MRSSFLSRRGRVLAAVLLLSTSAQAAGAEITVAGPVVLAARHRHADFERREFTAVPGSGDLVVSVGAPRHRMRPPATWVWLNGRRVVGPGDLHRGGSPLRVPVALAEENRIAALIIGHPGSRVRLRITEEVGVELEAGPPGIGLDDERLLVALPIMNHGERSAFNVTVTSVVLDSAQRLAPADLPVGLPEIGPDGDAVLEAEFSGERLVSGETYDLRLAGAFEVGRVHAPFALRARLRVPFRSPGSAPTLHAVAYSHRVEGAPFPDVPVLRGAPLALNEEPVPPVPTGTPRGDMRPRVPPTELGIAPEPRGDAGSPGVPGVPGLAAPGAIATPQATDPVIFLRSSSYGSYSGTWLDPSGASNEPVVMATFNGPTAVSFDGGVTFPLTLNPNAVFPPADGGFCCDQQIQYVPQIDRFVWLLQYRRAFLPGDVPCKAKDDPPGCGPHGPNRYRVAVSSTDQIIASGGTAWTFWDLPPSLFGHPAGWVDYPSLVFGDHFLYLSADMMDEGGGYFVARIPLGQLAAGGVIDIRFTDPADAIDGSWMAHLAQNVTDTAYWAGHNGNSKLRVFSFPEDSIYYSWHDVPVESWPNKKEGYSSVTPSGFDWLGHRVGAAIIGATRLARQRFLGDQVLDVDEVWFAWQAGRGGGFAHPHIQIVAIDTYDYSRIKQRQIYNQDFAFGYPELASNAVHEVGVALALGGGDAHTTFGVGLVNDPVIYIPEVTTGSRGRFGDYFALRRHSPNDQLFSAFGLYYNVKPGFDRCDPSSNCTTELHYFLFGRESALEPPPPPPK